METIVVQEESPKSKLLIKGLIIGFLVLVLLIPLLYVQNLVEERESRQKEAINEVNSKWAGEQAIAGPILVIPYLQVDLDTANKKVLTKRFAYILPNDLQINATVNPQEKHRGIYKVMLYTSTIDMKGSFTDEGFNSLQLAPDQILWKDAFVQFNVGDTKGLNEELKLNWNDTVLAFTTQPGNTSTEGLSAPLPLQGVNDLKNIRFSGKINVSGSEALQFCPVGKTTSVQMSSFWPNPSFSGDVLPQTTSVTANGFTAQWKSVAFKRSFPQQWKDEDYTINNTSGTATNKTGYNLAKDAFGVALFVPVNNYQKTMRAIKYAVLCILLTFTAFFLIEMVNKKSVHPFHYGLIGLALVLFYTLLLSFSEYIGFNAAYAIASVSTIGLIGWFVKGLLLSNKLSVLLSLILALMYCYVFTILQLQDYSLILGSVGLFITLAIVMYFSKRFQW